MISKTSAHKQSLLRNLILVIVSVLVLSNINAAAIELKTAQNADSCKVFRAMARVYMAGV